MKELGWGSILAGAVMLVIAWFLPTTVPVEDTRFLSSIGETIGTGTYQQVLNIGKLQTQLLVWQAGLVLVVVGSIFRSAEAIATALTGHRDHPTPDIAVGAAEAGHSSGPLPPEPRDDFNSAMGFSAGEKYAAYAIGAVIGIVLLVSVLTNLAKPSAADAGAAVADNVEAIADNLEMTADNLEALADAPAPAPAVAAPETSGLSESEMEPTGDQSSPQPVAVSNASTEPRLDGGVDDLGGNASD